MKSIHITVDPEICGGTPVFSGTRVFVETLFDYLEGGDSIVQFMDDFPSVKKEQIEGVIELAKLAVVA